MNIKPTVTVENGYIITRYPDGSSTKIFKSEPLLEIQPVTYKPQPTQDDILTEILIQTTYTNCLLELGI